MTKTALLLSFVSIGIFGQNFTKQDTLKGSNTEYRNFWDVKKYDITLEADYQTKSIKGSNKISFEITTDVVNPTFQIDLQQPMKTAKLKSSFAKNTTYKHEDDFIFIPTKRTFKKGEKLSITIDYEGNPVIAQKAPWDGGWIFTTDNNGNPWMTAADEGIGASIWLPCKDIWEDEPDYGISFKIITSKDLVGVANGKLIETKKLGKKTSYLWEVKNPINAYSIIPSIGKYVNFNETFDGEKGKLDLSYWVLDYNLDKAKKQFSQVKPMMKSFEYWFGAYPFYEDSYKIVESPHLGMEHQSNVAYGNRFENGYLGRDLSGSGVGLKWDFIIIHESGHEWFANNITAKDQADMWIHEAFTSYSETLYTESLFGKEDANAYVIGTRKAIQNDRPIIGKFGVRHEGSGDMYYKGANMLHTIRQVINDDEKFRQILRGLNKDFYHQTVTGKQIENYFIQKSGINLQSIFDQYLTTTYIPTLEYKQNGTKLEYRWTHTIKGFTMPLYLPSGESIIPKDTWQTTELKSFQPVEFSKNYYILYNKL
ncbi:M1 family metallopeptidase [Chryseobacterium sp. POL2]|uniref:M1 family metallopeptidase n=1 Tax=Chryseobacterium sp. POL2 TaxID=2713414 RepID=UPI0013E1A072|nr:M1 family metallopeptidase [Chryseobacterium sp. POL2]QIG88372.1 M1 family metallopeptidase [Chryseobacterium sp. POL2]